MKQKENETFKMASTMLIKVAEVVSSLLIRIEF